MRNRFPSNHKGFNMIKTFISNNTTFINLNEIAKVIGCPKEELRTVVDDIKETIFNNATHGFYNVIKLSKTGFEFTAPEDSAYNIRLDHVQLLLQYYSRHRTLMPVQYDLHVKISDDVQVEKFEGHNTEDSKGHELFMPKMPLYDMKNLRDEHEVVVKTAVEANLHKSIVEYHQFIVDKLNMRISRMVYLDIKFGFTKEEDFSLGDVFGDMMVN